MCGVNMSGLKREKILTRRPLGAKIALFLWPLVLYSLIQIATNSIPQDHHDPHVGRPEFHQDSKIHSSLSRTSSVCQRRSAQEEDDDTFIKLIQDTINKKPCSSASKISFPHQPQSTKNPQQARPLLSSAAYYLSSSTASLLKQIFTSRRSIFGGKILMAEASSLYEPNSQDSKEIIILNSTNFNTELIQHHHQFPHIKLIEYYVSFCGFCAKFKSTYLKLAKDISPWRNVIRPSAIDLGVSSNSPIAHSWSVEVVPTLRIHPPPNPSLAEKLDKQLSLSGSKSLSSSDLQKSMFNEYNTSSLMIHSLNVEQYMDNVNLLKADLLQYIERYVSANSQELPATWPNLRPVTENSLIELRRNHPRQQLFLLIEGGQIARSSDKSSSVPPSLALNIMMELSSSAPWKAIRYVRASENKALVQDVIAQQRKISEQQAQPDNSINEQVELLNNLALDQNQEGNNIFLVHIDDSHSSVRSGGYASAYPFMTIVTGKDLEIMEQSVLIEQHNNFISRAKREWNPGPRKTRSLFDSGAFSINKMSNERKIELITLYIKQVYADTKEDREFVQAISNQGDTVRGETPAEETIKVLDRLTNTKSPLKRGEQQSSDVEQKLEQDQQSLFNKIYNLFNPPEKKQNIMQSSSSCSSDYDDKLKAIRYMLFNEIPRTTIIDKSPSEQQEKLNILINLVTVIKTYFPLPDSSSIQFIDGVQSYLIKQKNRLSSISNQDRDITNFDTRAFKQELKRLESEDKRLPEIGEWKHCKSGYPCALWRLFHTLVAFEYKKLSQLRQISQQLPLPPTPPRSPATASLHHHDNINLSPSLEAITMKSTNSNGPPSPVERLVSPPSTTTSLSLTIATLSRASNGSGNSDGGNSNKKPLTEADLPTPVLLVMRDYITTFYSCEECKRNFRQEAAELSLEKIRQEPAEFSILWLWETHNRVNKRLSVDPEKNPQDHPKVWFPTYDQCAACYKKPPSFLEDTTVDPVTIFHESIEWNRPEILSYLVREYTRQPLDNQTNIFGYPGAFGFGYLIVTSCLILVVVFRCTSYYIERQRRHKATLLNGNGAHYTLELH